MIQSLNIEFDKKNIKKNRIISEQWMLKKFIFKRIQIKKLINFK
jgi:hypothetical protein